MGNKIALMIHVIVFVFMVYITSYTSTNMPWSWLNTPNTVFTILLGVTFMFRVKLYMES